MWSFSQRPSRSSSTDGRRPKSFRPSLEALEQRDNPSGWGDLSSAASNYVSTPVDAVSNAVSTPVSGSVDVSTSGISGSVDVGSVQANTGVSTSGVSASVGAGDTQVSAGAQPSGVGGFTFVGGVSSGSTSVSANYGYNPTALPGQNVYNAGATYTDSGGQFGGGGGVSSLGTLSAYTNWQQGSVGAGVGGNYNPFTDTWGANGYWYDPNSSVAAFYNNNPDPVAGPVGASVSYISPSVQWGAGVIQNPATGEIQNAWGGFNDGYTNTGFSYGQDPNTGAGTASASYATPSTAVATGYSTDPNAQTGAGFVSYSSPAVGSGGAVYGPGGFVSYSTPSVGTGSSYVVAPTGGQGSVVYPDPSSAYSSTFSPDYYWSTSSWSGWSGWM
jgi:hypothetical protein